MGSGSEVNDVGRAITDFARQPGDAGVRNRVNDEIAVSGIMQDPTQLVELNRKLEDAGTIPQFLLSEMHKLDVDRRSTGIQRNDLNQIVQNSRDYAPTTVLAARYALKNFGNINSEGAWYEQSNILTRNMFEQYAKTRKAIGGTLDPEHVFAERNNSYDGDSSRGAEMKGWASSLFDTFKSWRQSLKDDRFAAKEPMQGMSDADFGPGRVCIDGKEGYRVGERDFVKNDDGDWQYKIQRGDTLNVIARHILRDKYGYEPSQADVERAAGLFEERNGYNKGGRSRDRIYADDTMIVPAEYQF